MRAWIEQIEERLTSLSGRDRIALYLFVVMAIVGMGYMFLFEPLVSEYEHNEATIRKLQRQIVKNDPKKAQKRLQAIQRQLLSLRTEIDTLRMKRDLLSERLRQKSYMIFNDKTLANFLDIMLSNSLKQHVALLEVSIEPMKERFVGDLFAIKRVQTHFVGSFLPVVEYVRKTEMSPYLFRIEELNLSASEDGVEGRAVFTFYGVGR